jgi:hypothetical protein
MAKNTKKITLPALSMLKNAVEATKATEVVKTTIEIKEPEVVNQTEVLQIGMNDIGADGNTGVLADSTGDTDQTTITEPAPTPAPVVKQSTGLDDIVKVRMIPGTKEHGTKMSNGEYRWMVTPKHKGRERWYDRTKINGWGKLADGQMFAIVTRKEVAQRDMLDYIIPEAASAPSAADGDGAQA